MTEQEFLSLSKYERIDLLSKEGKSLNTAIFLDGYIVKLYSLNHFFVEVYSRNRNIEWIQILDDEDLEKYLEGIQLGSLTS